MEKDMIETMENWLTQRIEPLAEDLAAKIAPMATHMTVLAEETERVLKHTQGETERQCKQLNDQMQSMIKDWEQKKQAMIEQWQDVTQDMKQQSQETMKATKAFQKMKWAKLLIVALVISVVSPISYDLWQNHFSKSAKERVEKAKGWDLFMDKYMQLTEKQKQTVNKTLGIEWE